MCTMTQLTNIIYSDITSGLLIASGYLPKKQLQEVVLDTSLMAHIHRWFQNKDMTTAKIGVVRINMFSRPVLLQWLTLLYH